MHIKFVFQAIPCMPGGRRPIRNFKVLKWQVLETESEQPQFIASAGNRNYSNTPLIENSDTEKIVVPDVSLIHSFIVCVCLDLCVRIVVYHCSLNMRSAIGLGNPKLFEVRVGTSEPTC